MGASNILEILINAKDQTGDAIKSASSGFKDMGKNLTDLGSSLTMIGAPFAALGAAAVKSFSDSQKAVAQLEAVIKSTGGAAGVTKEAALDLAASIQKVTAFSDDAVVGGENMLLTFTNIGKDTFPRATKAMVDLSQAMGQDLKSSAIQLGKALNDPTAGITALTRVGVTFTQAQKDQIEAMQKAGDVAGAQAVILAELEKEFGGSAEAAGKTFAGQLEILKNRLDDILESIGEQIIPVLQEFMGWIGKLIDWFNDLSPSVKEFIVKIGMALASLAAVGPVLMAVGKGVSLFGTLLGALASPLGLIMAAVAAVGLAFETNFLGIRDLLEPIIKVFERAWSALQQGQNPLRVLKTLFYNLLPKPIADALANVINGIRTLIGVIGNMGNILKQGGIGLAISAIVNAFMQMFGLVGDEEMSSWAEQLGTTIVNVFNTVVGFITGTVIPALKRLADWFLNTALPAVIGFIQGTVIPAIQQFFDFLGNAWAVVGPALEHLAGWFIQDALPAVVGFITGTVVPGIQRLMDILGNIWTAIQPGLDKIANWFIHEALPFILSKISDFADMLGRIVGGIRDWLDKNPEFVTAIAAITGPLLAVGLAGVGLPIIIGLITAAAGALAGALAWLLSPVVLVSLALAALVAAVQLGYPGGIPQLLSDAATSAQNLAGILLGGLALAGIGASIVLNGFRDLLVAIWSKFGDLIISIAIVVGLMKLYELGVAAAAAIHAGAAGLNALITGAATGTSAFGASLMGTLLPLAAAVAAVWALISAYKELQKYLDTTQKAAEEAHGKLAGGVASGQVTSEQVYNQARGAANAQFGPIGGAILGPGIAKQAVATIVGDPNGRFEITYPDGTTLKTNDGTIVVSAVKKGYPVQDLTYVQGHDFAGRGTAGQSYTIGAGQVGKEAFIPGDNGTFIPDLAQVIANLMRGNSGGGGGQYVFNFAGGMPESMGQVQGTASQIISTLQARGVLMT